MAENHRIIAVIGPTASGKSALAMALAEAIGAEILCVDSMTVYRAMDIGTAKPSAGDRSRVVHHLLDIAEPNEHFAVNTFVERADACIAEARRRGVPLIAVGGTPMYFKALFDGLFEGPSADESLRESLRSLTTPELHARLREVDPIAAARIHVNDQRRLIRALEVFQLTGQPISSLQIHWEADSPKRHIATWIGLTWERDVLSRRINARVKEMVAAGWVQEVRGLLDRYGTLSKTAAEAAGYGELIAHVQGRCSLDDASEQAKIATRQLSRRQIKWFRRFQGVRWLAGSQPLESMLTALAPVLAE
ncbi:MAG TPA: tRNA (adenosine(37)-N6)-dimethylallyltransferase MiaA [Tepidisphaeraceae bacterium]|nr:tRNA (adenosine(37)-N6)-dimethylallyltransferase MiaA [Tepidisphaeraceae bacterium]